MKENYKETYMYIDIEKYLPKYVLKTAVLGLLPMAMHCPYDEEKA